MRKLLFFIFLLISGSIIAQPNWTVVTYTSSTTAYGLVTINGNPASAGDWVGAFVGAECRAKLEVITNDGKAYVNLQIQGESIETVAFKVWDASENKELSVSLTVQSNPGNVIGNPPNYLAINAESKTLNVSPSNQNVPASPTGSANFAVTSNSSWTAASNQPWCTVTPPGSGNGTIVATYSDNSTASQRIANITITVSGLTPIVVTVTQEPSCSLSVLPISLNFASPAGNNSVTVASNSTWTVSDDATWIIVSPTSGSGSGTLTIAVSANSGGLRSGTIIISGCNTTKTIAVTQDSSNSTLIAKVTDISCFGDTHPVAKVTATGEEGRTFYVQWAAVIGNVDGPLTAKIPFTGSLIVQDQLSYNSDNSNVGYYHFYVSDNMGSTVPIIGFAFGKVQNPLQATLVQDGLNAEITITGGILPYFYQVGSGAMINLPVDGNTFQVVGLQDPSTVVTVYDAHGCFVSKSLAVAPLAVTAVPESGNNMDKTFDVVLNFNRDVIVPVNGIIVTGGTALVTGSGKVYTVAITAEDLAEVKVILANTNADADGNLLNATTFIYNVGDHVAPTLVVTPPNIPIATVFNVGLAFSEPVSGVLGAVTVIGGTLTSFSAGSGGKNYTLSISSTEQSLVTIIISNAIKDLSINKNPFAGQTLIYTSGDFASPELISWTPTNVITKDNHPTFKMTFSENVNLGAGGNLKIYKVATTTPVLTIPITVTMISGKDVTVNYNTLSGLDKNTNYYVLIEGSALKDNAGNLFTGLNNVAAWTFKTGANFATPNQQEIGAPEFNVYPNPTTGIITIEGLYENQKTKIAVFTANGKLIMKKTTYESQDKIDISKQVPGTYILIVNKQTVKIIKE